MESYYDLLERARTLLNHPEASIKDFAAETLKEIDVFGYAEGSYAYVLFTRSHLSIRINK